MDHQHNKGKLTGKKAVNILPAKCYVIVENAKLKETVEFDGDLIFCSTAPKIPSDTPNIAPVTFASILKEAFLQKYKFNANDIGANVDCKPDTDYVGIRLTFKSNKKRNAIYLRKERSSFKEEVLSGVDVEFTVLKFNPDDDYQSGKKKKKIFFSQNIINFF